MRTRVELGMDLEGGSLEFTCDPHACFKGCVLQALGAPWAGSAGTLQQGPEAGLSSQGTLLRVRLGARQSWGKARHARASVSSL